MGFGCGGLGEASRAGSVRGQECASPVPFSLSLLGAWGALRQAQGRLGWGLGERLWSGLSATLRQAPQGERGVWAQHERFGCGRRASGAPCGNDGWWSGVLRQVSSEREVGRRPATGSMAERLGGTGTREGTLRRAQGEGGCGLTHETGLAWGSARGGRGAAPLGTAPPSTGVQRRKWSGRRAGAMAGRSRGGGCRGLNGFFGGGCGRMVGGLRACVGLRAEM